MSVNSGCGLILTTSWVPTTFPNSTGDVLLQFAGEWHVTAIASNCSVFLKMKDGMKSSTAIVTQGSCGLPGVHPACSLLHLGPSLGSSCCPALPGPPVWGWLLGFLAFTSPYFGSVAAAREQDVSPQLLQKFMELIPTMGLTEDMLAILPKSGEWPKAEGPRALQT
uniref:Uncharacterized protein n=1 Tax=Geospiza parvula TaxID=87175 RepID=A0A8C3NMQ9_GEOPR